MANNVKKVWASGKAVVNAWLAIPSGFSAEVIAQCGFDSVTVETHSDADAIDKAKVAAKTAMESGAHPEHIDIEERREGIIAYNDCVGPMAATP